MWTPIKLTNTVTGQSIHITILERELYLDGLFTFDDLYEICNYREEVNHE